jgi:hypothetical protein
MEPPNTPNSKTGGAAQFHGVVGVLVHFGGVPLLQLQNSNPTVVKLHSGVLEWSYSFVEWSHIKHALIPFAHCFSTCT